MSALWSDSPPAPRLARRLLGSVLCTDDGAGRTTSGRIVETEAYLPRSDPACHAHHGPTRRNGSMFGPSGIAYVYRIYGLHHCLNVVSGVVGDGEAVLIRALEPLEGLERMAARRGVDDPRRLCDGPAKLVVALGVGPRDDGRRLNEGRLRIEAGQEPPAHRVRVTRRVGLTRGAGLALRFDLRGSAWISRRW